MMPDLPVEVDSLIMRAYSVIQQTSGVVFVGIYSMETFEPLALTDRDRVCANVTRALEDDPASTFDVCLHQDELRAIVTHIQTRDNVLARIDIAGLRFLCLRNGTKCMTGVSNFNTDISADEANKVLYKITKKLFSVADVAAGFHALQLSALIKEDKLVVGISKSDQDSSLKTIKQIFEPHDLQIRASTKAEKERRRDKIRRETSFCEDWRTATIRSIETLKMIGQFQDDDISDDDDSPLMSNAQPTALSPISIPDIDKQWPVSFKTDDDSDNTRHKPQGVVRRPSRATMV